MNCAKNYESCSQGVFKLRNKIIFYTAQVVIMHQNGLHKA